MKRLLFFVLCLLLISSSCKDETEQPLRMQNNSDKTIYFDWSSAYPDSSLQYIGDPTGDPYQCKVNAKSISHSAYLSPNKNYFGSRDMDTMIIFVFDAEVIDALSWDSVRSKGLVLKRYFLSLDDLEEMNWIVNYP